jgi:urease subunit gamma
MDMLLSPHEQEKLLVHVAGQLARDRRARGLRLNYPEAVALITSWVLESARDGRSVAELMAGGQRVLGRHDVMDGVPEMITSVQVEVTSQTARSWSPCTGQCSDRRTGSAR